MNTVKKPPVRDRHKTEPFNFSKWVVDLFKDERETPSIKPVIAFIGCLFLCSSMVANALIPTYAPIDYLVEAVMIITSIGMGSDSIDKFSRKKSIRGRTGSYSQYDEYDESPYSGDSRYGGRDESTVTKDENEVL